MNTNSTLKEVVVNFTDGPSRDRLVDAFKYAMDDDARVSVSFWSKSGERIDIVPSMLEHEDGSGQSFNGHGYVHVDMISGHKVANKYVYFYFQTKSRQGYVKFEAE